MSFSEQEKEEFKAEARELLDVAEKSLLALDEGAEFQTTFDAVFRSFHNLKGASGMMDLHQLQAHTHGLENILMPFKDKTNMSKNYVSFFLRGIDGARSLLDDQEINFSFEVPEEEKVQPEVPCEPSVTPNEVTTQSALDEFIAESGEIMERVSGHLRVIEAGTYSKETLNDAYRDMHSLKGAAFLFGYAQVGELAHGMESSLEPLRDGTHQPSKLLVDSLFQAVEWVDREMISIQKKVPDEKNHTLLPMLKKVLSLATSRLEPVIAKEQVKKLTDESSLGSTSALDVQTATPKEKEVESAASIRVPVALLDNLMTLMGEMVLVRNQVLQFSSNSEDLEFQNLSKRLNGVTSEIQAQMMKTRMQPIGNILTKFHRVVRDLSHELKKEINLTLSGAETELDKSLLEAIKDPLTHIVRNSCDHGIETPETRKNMGKPGEGTIQVKSYHEGGQVVIEVSDDGKGLNRDVLVKKAREKGLMTEAQVASWGDKEIFNLIFAPGFSTAATVTNVSGRGVGMDVVRTNIERIGGTVELSSVAHQGTTLKLKIPLTLAIVPALIIRCAQGSFAIPQVKLEELVRVDASSADHQIEYLHGTPVYRLRGNILPLVDLNQILGLEKRKIEERAVSNIAVLNADQCSFGLIVDEVQDTADIVVKPLNRLLKSLQIYSGATILGDGSIALILDVHGLSKVAKMGSEKARAENEKRIAEESRKFDLQEFLLVRLNSPTQHAIVLNYVHRLEEFKRSNIELSGGHRVIRYGNSILPILSVSDQLGYAPAKIKSSEPDGSSSGIIQSDATGIIQVVVIQKAGMLYGLEVEEIVDTLSTDVDMDTTLAKQTGIFGNLNMPNELIVAIDPFELIAKAYPESEVSVVSDGREPIREEKRVQNHAPVLVPQKLKILLVEDTAFFRKAVTIVLEKAGHEVAIAIAGNDALDLLEKNPQKFDLIISDIEMPYMNGFELAKAVRANSALAGIPMLALSSRADKTYAERGIQSGFNLYLEKLKPVVLLEAIDQLSATLRRAA